MFRVLVPGASYDDIRSFKDMVVRNKNADYQQSDDDIFQISVSLNKETYERLMKEDADMCDALRELFKDEIIECEKMGEIRGVIKLCYDDMNLSPSQIIDKIMARFGLDRAEAEKYVEETLDLQSA